MIIDANTSIQLTAAVDAATDTKKTPDLKTEDPEELKDACKDFEAVLLNMMFKEMRKSTADGGFFGDSHQGKMYESMVYEKLSDDIAHGDNNLGIGDYLFNELTRQRASK